MAHPKSEYRALKKFGKGHFAKGCPPDLKHRLNLPRVFSNGYALHNTRISCVATFDIHHLAGRPPSRTEDSAAIKMLYVKNGFDAFCAFRELAILSGTQGHPHIVKLLAAYSPHDTLWSSIKMRKLYFVCEKLSDMNLAQRIRKEAEKPVGEPHGFPHRTISLVIAQLADALLYLHGQCHIVHRDIKPHYVGIVMDGDENILQVKLLDFGLSTTALRDKDGMSRRRPMSDAQVGTDRYRAPEILMGLEIGQEVDVWGLGCIAFEMAVLQPIFDKPPFIRNPVESILVYLDRPVFLHDVLCRFGPVSQAMLEEAKKLKNQDAGIMSVLDDQHNLPSPENRLPLVPSTAPIRSPSEPETALNADNWTELIKKMLLPDRDARIKLPDLKKQPYVLAAGHAYAHEKKPPPNPTLAYDENVHVWTEEDQKKKREWKKRIAGLLTANEDKWKWVYTEIKSKDLLPLKPS